MSMKTNTYLALAAVGCVILGACAKGGENATLKTLHVNVDAIEQSVRTSVFVSEAKAVALETNDDCLIDEIACIRLKGDMLYISDGASFFKFDLNGNFVSKIQKRGDGPEEYSYAGMFDVDANGDIVLTNDNKLLRYDWSGRKLSESPMASQAFDIRFCKDGTLIAYSGNMGSTDQKVFETNGNSLSNGYLLNKDSIMAKYMFVFGIDPLFTPNADGLYLSEFFNDTIYTIKDNSVSHNVVYDYGGRNIPLSFLHMSHENIMTFFQDLQKTNYIRNLGVYMESSSFYINSFMADDLYYSLISKDGEINLVTKQMHDDILFHGYKIAPIRVVDAATFVSVVEPAMLSEYAQSLSPEERDEVKRFIKNSDEEPNPIIYIASMK